MFEGFANVWTPVTAAVDVKDKPVGLRVAGEAIVIFRDRRGGVGALLDRCPHRGVALSLGEVTREGLLECPFHAWSFRTDGGCARVPLSDVPEAKRARLAATALPAREVGGLIWVFTGPDPAGTEPEPAPGLIEPGWYGTVQVDTWDTHWTRAMENMIDMVHLPFVHRRTIGRFIRSRLKENSRLAVEVEPTSWGAELRSSLDGAPSGDGGIAWRRPNGMELRMFQGKWHGHVFCVPIDEGHTRMIFSFTRKFLRNGAVTAVLNHYNRRIGLEDKALVESSRPKEVPPAGEELSVATDAPTLYFRRYYYRELRASSATLLSPAKLAARRSGSAPSTDADEGEGSAAAE